MVIFQIFCGSCCFGLKDFQLPKSFRNHFFSYIHLFRLFRNYLKCFNFFRMEQIMVIATLELSLMKTKKKLIEVILQHRPHKYQKSSFSSPVQFDSLSLHTQTLQNNWDKKGFFNDPEHFART